MSDHRPVIVWFQNDLRLADHPALTAALKTGQPIIPIYIYNTEEKTWPIGNASKWWLHHSLQSLSEQIKQLKGKLILQTGDPKTVLSKIAKNTKATQVFFNHSFEPVPFQKQLNCTECLEKQDVICQGSNDAFLHHPATLLTKSDSPYKVFTPFWKNILSTTSIAKPLPTPRHWPSPSVWPISVPLTTLDLLPTFDWAKEIKHYWQPGSPGAAKQLKHFIKNALENYAIDRDFPAIAGISCLSPHLHFGEISSRTVWHMVHASGKKNAEVFLRQLAWREFAYHTFYHFPESDHQPLHPKFNRFSWHHNKKQLIAWQQGRTGYPIVDAGMRQLWTIGWMHNRVRMIVASFLTKDLLIPWQEGAKWFWDTLVDADLPNNSFGWQWVAGCGADAAPYFRIFNPVLQSKKFDAKGKYIKKWLPELTSLPDKWIHTPWLAPEDVLEKANVTLGKNYPHPIVDHAVMRDEAMRRYRAL